MAISLQQVQRQSQRLIMTPQMQQSIQLLQMNAVELEQLTQAELLENPFLQLEEDRSDTSDESSAAAEGPSDTELASGESPPADAASSESAAPESEDTFAKIESEVEADSRATDEHLGIQPLPEPKTAEEPPAPTADQPSEDATPSMEEDPAQFDKIDVNWEEFYDGSENRTYTHQPDEAVREFTEYTALKESLYDHLMWQLRLCVLEGSFYEAGEYLLGCLDENGYLSEGALQETAEKFALSAQDAEHVLNIVQEFEPTGVAARTAAECLLLQMKALGSYSETAQAVLEEHFESLQRKKFKDIARSLSVTEKEILDIYHKVGRLEPKPGRSYTKDSVQYITPDVSVKIIDGEMMITLNEGRTGHLSVNRLYRRMLRLQRSSFTKEEKDYAQEKFRSALMLIKNVEKRKSTILRVTEAIMEVQREFLDKGVEALRPLTLREIADVVGMHESTIARVTSKKYVETPQGVYLLKYFFSSSIASTNGTGEAVSSRSIKEKLSQLIADEDPKKPFSDQKLSETLNRSGYSIARRTVAKYREQLKILPAKLRREA